MFNSLPTDNSLDWSKLKAFAGYKKNVTEKLKLVLGQVKNIIVQEDHDGPISLTWVLTNKGRALCAQVS